MKLCTGKNLFFNKNIQKRINSKSYTFSEPISKEAGADLVSSFAKISLCDLKIPITETALLTTPMVKRPANRKFLIFEENSGKVDQEVWSKSPQKSPFGHDWQLIIKNYALIFSWSTVHIRNA